MASSSWEPPLLAVGCGPVQSTQRISQAEVAFERARVVEAHQKAPYEYKSAQYYLHKAKEEWGYSDFEASYDYATEAKSAAEAARLKAKEDPWPGHPVLGTSELKASDADKGPEGYTDEDEEASGPEGYMEEDEGSGSSESEDNGDTRRELNVCQREDPRVMRGFLVSEVCQRGCTRWSGPAKSNSRSPRQWHYSCSCSPVARQVQSCGVRPKRSSH